MESEGLEVHTGMKLWAMSVHEILGFSESVTSALYFHYNPLSFSGQRLLSFFPICQAGEVANIVLMEGVLPVVVLPVPTHQYKL